MPKQLVDEGVPADGIAEGPGGAAEIQLASGVRATQPLNEFAAKDPAEHLHRQEEARIFRANPASAIRREATGRNDAVHVRMLDQGLPPGVEDAQETDLSTEVSGIGGDFEQRRRAGAKEQVIQARGVALAQRIERVRQREDDMDVRHVEQLALARGQPALSRLSLTLGTVPVATGVVRDGPMSAGATLIEMTAERGGPTPPERAQDGALLHAQPRMPLEEVVALRVEDIGHLHGGPAHGRSGLRNSRE